MENKISYYSEQTVPLGTIPPKTHRLPHVEERDWTHHPGQPCCRRRARQSHLSHTSQRLHNGSFLCRAQQTTPSSGRGCSRVSNPSQADLWGVTLGYIYDSTSWDEGGPKRDHQENIRNEPNETLQVEGFYF